jgi:hypothetical protein
MSYGSLCYLGRQPNNATRSTWRGLDLETGLKGMTCQDRGHQWRLVPVAAQQGGITMNTRLRSTAGRMGLMDES